MAGYRRFSLRTLVIVMTALTLWIGYASYRANRQRGAVEALRAQGAQVRYAHEYEFDAKHGPVRRAEITNAPLPGPDWLRGVVGEHYFIRPLVLWHVKDPASLVDLAGVEEIYGLQLDDREVHHLRGAPRLKVLMLNKMSTVSDYGFLAELPELVHFSAIHVAFDDEDAAHLRRLSNLGWLQLGGTRISDAGLAELRHLPRLQFLMLNGTKVTDEGVRYIAACSNLERLTLTDTAITDGSVKQLAKLKNLTYLSVGGTKITDEGVAALRKALPNSN
jgi:Leucine-rich repeat (LRR) protein